MKFAAATALALSVFAPARAQTPVDTRPSFAEWLAGVRTEALGRGIRPEIVDEALTHIDEPLPVVIERDRTQAETVLPLETYVSRRVTPVVIKTGRDMFAKHRALLDRVRDTYGVSPAVIVSIWGLESNFGQFSGVRPTVAALATLAWDPGDRRFSAASCSTRSRSSTAGTSSSGKCRVRGPARWASRNSCRRAI